MANTLTHLIRIFDSRFVGQDQFGNRYYQRRRPDPWGRIKRFVIYKNQTDASLIPPEYHGWMHYTVDEFPMPADVKTSFRAFYQKPHRPNLSGSRMAYRPTRAPATGDYQPWSPTKKPSQNNK